jgi:5-formyltetrahydrofolate cyclo-ligase
LETGGKTVKTAFESKGDFRSGVRSEVIRTGSDRLHELSLRITGRLARMPEVAEADTIMLYHPLYDEVDLMTLAVQAMEQGKTVCFPACVHSDRSIVIRRVSNFDSDFYTSPIFNLREPLKLCPAVPPEEVDTVIVPGRAFDPSGNRVGRGKGYYDNFLKSTHFTKIAAGFSFQVFDRVPTDSHDIPLDFIVTEETVITCSAGPEIN